MSKTSTGNAAKRISCARDNLAYSLFYEFLPFYHTVVTELPAIIKLKLILNDFSSVFHACQILINEVSDKKMRREMTASLRHELVWKTGFQNYERINENL